MNNSVDATMGKPPDSPERLREEFENLARAAETLSASLKMRDKDRFNHLLSQEALALLHGTCAQAANMLREQTLDISDSLSTILKQFGNALEKIGNAPRESGIRDSTESLETVQRNLRRIYESVNAMGNILAKREEEAAKESVRIIGNLESTLNARIRWLGRKIDALQAINDVRF